MSLEAGEEAFDPVEEFDKRFAARGSIFAACRRGVITANAERLHNKTHYEENADSRKDDFARGEYLRSSVRHRRAMRQLTGTHRTDTLTKGSRECIEDTHGRSEPLGESLVASPRII